MTIEIRRAEPTDYKGMRQIFAGSKVVWGTLQMPFPSLELWRKRLEETSDGTFRLVACSEDEIVGQLDLYTFPNHPRRRHVGQIGMAVRDDFQSQGVGTKLMQAVVDLADNWLNLQRLELNVYIDNEPALHLYKKFDFEIEGTMTRYAFRSGQYVNVYAMARLR